MHSIYQHLERIQSSHTHSMIVCSKTSQKGSKLLSLPESDTPTVPRPLVQVPNVDDIGSHKVISLLLTEKDLSTLNFIRY
jgi:hypothetical protein